MGLEPDRSWVRLKVKSVWLKSITSCKLFRKNHIIQFIYSVLNKSTINKREISTDINNRFNLFWSPVLVESSCMTLRDEYWKTIGKQFIIIGSRIEKGSERLTNLLLIQHHRITTIANKEKEKDKRNKYIIFCYFWS